MQVNINLRRRHVPLQQRLPEPLQEFWLGRAHCGLSPRNRWRAEEFLRRFLVHLLPRGFVKVLHYGLLANRYRPARVDECRRLLLVVSVLAGLASGAPAGPAATSPPCPLCGGEMWQLQARVARPRMAELCRLPLGVDSS
jgi:hypothetical protein